MKRKSRRLPPHIVLPNGQWRFVKRGRKVAAATVRTRRRVNTMRKKRGFSRKGGRGGLMGMLAPALAGVADNVINPRSPIDGIGSVVVGFALKNQFCKDIGMYQVGQSAAGYIPFIGSMTGGSGVGQSQV